MRYLRRLNKLFWLANAGLAVLLTLLVWSLVKADKAVPDDPDLLFQEYAKRRLNVADSDRMPDGDPSLILERDIFGAAKAQARRESPTVVRNIPKPKPVTRKPVPFRVIGTVVSEEGDSYAILEDLDAKTQDIYRVGDSRGDVRINKIEQNRVIVMNLGVREVLDLTLGETRRLTAARTVAETEPAVKQPNNAHVVRTATNGEREINARASAAKLTDAASSLLGRMELSPHTVEGESEGLQISGLGDSMVAKLAGLQDGDVIHSVNGHLVTNQRKALQVLKKARKVGSAQVELSRGQETKSLAFRMGAW